MRKEKVYNFVVLIEQDSEGWFIAKVPDIQGCHTQGKTISQVLERIKEAIRVCLEAEKIELPQTKFIGLQTVQIKAWVLCQGLFLFPAKKCQGFWKKSVFKKCTKSAATQDLSIRMEEKQLFQFTGTKSLESG